MLSSQRSLPNTINSALVPAWFEACERSHGKRCAQISLPPSLASGRFRVIDLLRGCITPMSSGCKYLALSYVWGDVKQLELKKDNFDALTQERPFPDNFAGSSNTVMDAMLFCRLIGERFLWIDTLCIIQDDAVDKSAQLKTMGLIYGCAYATIVAAAGSSANHSLPGVRAGSRPCLPTETVEGLHLTAAQRHCVVSILKSPWNSRGWTFQENFFSKRQIIFTSEQVVFSCTDATWREDGVIEAAETLNLGTQFRPRPDVDLGRLAAGLPPDLDVFPFFNTYTKALASYCHRKLTLQDDILNAFDGLLSLLSPSLHGFRYGLPSVCFEAVLTWKSKDRFPLRRRADYPTWSWAGWQGFTHPVEFGSNEPRSSLDFKGFGAKVSWYNLQDDGSLVMINNENPHHFSGGELDSRLREQTRSNYYPENVNFPADLKPPLGQYLVFWTSATTFKVSRTAKRHLEIKPMTGLMHRHEEFTIEREPGGVKLNQISTIRLDSAWRASQPGRLEFIAVATTSQCEVLAMLIRWEGEVAYRVQMASAPIDSTEWIRSGSQRKMIILG